MSKVTFFMLPEPGHLLPTFRLAAMLRSQGHHVEYMTISDFRDNIVGQGFGFLPLLARFFDSDFGVGDMFETQDSGDRVYRAVGQRFAGDRAGANGELARDLMATAPDLLIIDSAVCCFWSTRGGECDLERLNCPILRVSSSFTEQFDVVPLPRFLGCLPELVLCPRELDVPWAAPAAHERHFVEASVLRTRPETRFPWEWIDPRRKLVYCSLGTQSSAYQHAAAALRQVIAAFRELDNFQLVLAVGGGQQPADFGEAPSNVLICKSVPQLDILSRAAALITHGGLGTIKEGILAGAPMIVLPFLHDQPLNGQRIEYHGLGVSLPASTCSAGQLRDALLRITNDSAIRNNCAAFRSAFSRIEDQSPSLAHVENRLKSWTAAAAP
jgi:UDP:flavonoid glycosyltransferase YjiC (YdhE family)